MNIFRKEFWDKDRKLYLFLFAILFLAEAFIALFVKDKIIRPYFGDILVIVLLYFAVRIIFKNTNKNIALFIFLFAVFIEFLQYIKIIEILNLQNNKAARIIIGTTFDFKDIICYFIGTISVLLFEKIWDKIKVY